MTQVSSPLSDTYGSKTPGVTGKKASPLSTTSSGREQALFAEFSSILGNIATKLSTDDEMDAASLAQEPAQASTNSQALAMAASTQAAANKVPVVDRSAKITTNDSQSDSASQKSAPVSASTTTSTTKSDTSASAAKDAQADSSKDQKAPTAKDAPVAAKASDSKTDSDKPVQAKESTQVDPRSAATPTVADQASTAAATDASKSDAVSRVASQKDSSADAENGATSSKGDADPASEISAAVASASTGGEQGASSQAQTARPVTAIPDFSIASSVGKDVQSSASVSLDKMLQALVLNASDSAKSAVSDLTERAVQDAFLSGASKGVGAVGSDVLGKMNDGTSQALQNAQVATAAKNTTTTSPKSDTSSKTPTPFNPVRTLEKVEAALKEVAKAKDGSMISLRLDPPSLGSVKVDVSLKDGVLHARISADSEQVSALLRDKAHELQGSLRKLGLNVEKVTVAVGPEQFSLNRDGDSPNSGSQKKLKDGNAKELEDQAGGLSIDKELVGSNAASGIINGRQSIDDHWVA